ncbi:ABC transporter ATP-binding protein [Chengkuizengella axinellae]|uniref:ABC transporter ATP-binding protein n=1 Tax=Chengkuizengella axinellae TaxID=3064388 RepID=A0ABT9J0I2_9BACL|nr:ABC transporter ATP-binding protein [Chengkuizengella sp. 2205SS18-9]MDP5274529.1 ABC transporter ATP-binding protein [Chengkuizengella sp. 2205SS18-9]
MTQSSVLEVKNVTKKINNKTIIDQISFSVNRGEIYGFLGPNGAGKTTTIRMIVGLMSLGEGDIIINGTSISKNFEKAMHSVGAIVENPEMYKFLSGYQNLVHYARMIPGISKARILEVTKLIGLEDRIHDKVKRYSLGMRQRLGIAQALLHKPSLLILDEPTNGLDPAGIRELRDYLRQLANEGISTLVSSHLLSEMELMCDRVAIIKEGKIIDVKSLKDSSEHRELQNKVIFEVNQPKKGFDIIKEKFEYKEMKLLENGFVLLLKREEIPKVNQSLVKEEILIYSINSTSKSLEDQFLELTN